MAFLKRARPARKKVPDPSKARKPLRYKNVGHKAVHGLQPGKVGKLELTPGEALALVQAGLLVLDETPRPVPGPKDKEAR